MRNLKDEIRGKKLQIRILEQRMVGSVERMPQGSTNIEISQVLKKKKLCRNTYNLFRKFREFHRSRHTSNEPLNLIQNGPKLIKSRIIERCCDGCMTHAIHLELGQVQ